MQQIEEHASVFIHVQCLFYIFSVIPSCVSLCCGSSSVPPAASADEGPQEELEPVTETPIKTLRMSGGVQQTLFFLGLPDLKKLVCISLTLQEEDGEPRSEQIKTCRELVLLYSDILASPALDSFTNITVIMAIPFFQKGVLRAFGQRRRLQLGSPQCVFPGDLQCCLSYSLITRLAPSWNKAGLYLISGKDFLTEGGRLNAVSMELSTSEGQLCISIEANTVRLPPTTLEDFDLPPLVLRRFCSDPDSILDPTSTGGTIWCHVLPSMKKGQIITISRQLPFRTYRDLQNHWNSLYGYRLPELAEEEVVYCSVYFRLVGERLFTYPLSCIRLQPVQRCPRADLQGALGSFLSAIRETVQSVCGFPARLASKPCYHTASLNTAASVRVLTTLSSVRPVLTQLPAPPPLRPKRSSFGSQPSVRTPLSQQAGAPGLLGDGYGFGGSLTQSQGCRGDGDWPSSSSSSSAHVSFSFSDSSGYQSAPSLSSSSFLPLFQQASSLTSSSSLFTPPSPQCQTSMNPALRPVPVFKNRHPSRHLNVALLRVQKQREHLSGGGEERRRVTLPAFGKNRPATAPPSASFAPPPILPPPTIPRFSRRPKPHSSTTPQPSAHPKIKLIPGLGPASKTKPRLILTPKPGMKLKSRSSHKTGSGSSTVANSSHKLQEKATKQPSAAPPEPPQPLTSSDMSNKDTSDSSRGGVVFQSKPKKSRAAIQDVDVEKMARKDQPSELNSVTLVAWLRGRGALVGANHQKEELMPKVVGCLAEA
ncbi:uncharacterized protein C18orf63-like isoform X10 [Xiphias gladius]|uniref:uncharacterized protein C18orf63-like isoform X10 n=1 Tax=Xiphias gladius TaxID=8245 RepID=UPI001A989CF9|nr:uncharacterized protein C18orf63-like isoform X10 [Xiphias gladius]